MKLDNKILLEYQKTKEFICDKAERVLKHYFVFKKWNIPTDLSIEDVDFYNDKVVIRYYGFQTVDFESLPIEYFLTLNNNLLDV